MYAINNFNVCNITNPLNNNPILFKDIKPTVKISKYCSL